MCTLTVLREPGRLLVTMNRDEARIRGPEAPPRRHAPAHPGLPAWAGPIDTDSGGTWIGANDRGVTACLLNRYAPGDDDPARLLPGQLSRGGIIPAVLAEPDADAALAHVRDELNPAHFGSFTLVLVTPASTHAFEWAHGGGLDEFTLGEPWGMLSSSAFDTAEVLQWRRERFEAWLHGGAPFEGALPAIHLDRPEGKEEWAILMDRPVSATRSITQVEWNRPQGAAAIRYWPRNDEERALSPQPSHTLTLQATA